MTEHWRIPVDRVILLASIGVGLAITVGSLMPGPPVPDVENGDKLMHLGGYAALAACWSLALTGRRGYVLLGSMLFGVLIECLQGLTPYRSFDMMDMLANGCGALLGTALMQLAAPFLDRRTRSHAS
ncbi:VanZ family protein [Chitinimonas arctica]|nr:VanZ family protein [Chitinimonas arctica]